MGSMSAAEVFLALLGTASVSAVAAQSFAHQFGRSGKIWGVIGFLFPILAVGLLLMLGRRNNSMSRG